MGRGLQSTCRAGEQKGSCQALISQNITSAKEKCLVGAWEICNTWHHGSCSVLAVEALHFAVGDLALREVFKWRGKKPFQCKQLGKKKF